MRRQVVWFYASETSLQPKFDYNDQIHGVGMREACNRPTTLLSLFYDHTSAVIMTCYKLSMPSGKSYNMWRFRRSMYVHHKLSQLYCWTVITDHSGTAIYRSPLMHTHATIFYVQLQNITRLRILQKTRTQSYFGWRNVHPCLITLVGGSTV